jgi:hypothetical protein
MAIWYILWSFGNFVVIGYIFPRLGTLGQEKSGNPGSGSDSIIFRAFAFAGFVWLERAPRCPGRQLPAIRQI